MMIGNTCCCDVPEFARKTAMLYVPFPGLGEFVWNPSGFVENRTSGWFLRKYLTYEIKRLNNNTGLTSTQTQSYNRYTGALQFPAVVVTDPGYTNTGGAAQPPVLVSSTFWYQRFIQPPSGPVPERIMTFEYRLSNAYEYADAIEFWQPYFDDLFPTSAMKLATTITAFSSVGATVESDRTFDFLPGVNHVIMLFPHGLTAPFGVNPPYNGGLWDGKFEVNLDYYVGVSVWHLSGNPANTSASPQTDFDVGFFKDGSTWRSYQAGLLFTKSCVRLPLGMNCDAEYDDGGNPPNPYVTQDVVRGTFDIATGIAERSEPNLRLSPGVYTFYDNITVHSGSILSTPPPTEPEGKRSYWVFREQLSAFDGANETRFARIPDHCPP